jgi:hypothetical protein
MCCHTQPLPFRCYFHTGWLGVKTALDHGTGKGVAVFGETA